MPFTDFIRHANTIGDNDWMRELSPLGSRQTGVFRKARESKNEHYDNIYISDVLRTQQTAAQIQTGMGVTAPIIRIPAMFDSREPDEYTQARMEAYEDLGAKPLGVYHERCTFAFVALGQHSAVSLRRQGFSARNCNLIVGHGLYTNQVILSMFYEDLSREMRTRLLNDASLAECAGYRLVFHKDANLREMLDLPAPLIP